jgi:CRP-like cAMP-binding protein
LALPEREQAVVRPDLECVTLRARDILYPADEPLTFVYFPQGAVLSVLTFMHNGAAVEIGTFGLEGLSGAQLILGGDRAPSQMICQIPGEALRMPVDRFLKHLKTERTFQRIVRRYTEALFNFMGQSIACNRLHTVDERCARWLLMSHDRVGGDQFDLTQEFLAIMLGVHRPGVSIAAAALQQAGFIRYVRGHVEIRDRKGLESAACECYQISADQFSRSLRRSVDYDEPVELLAY